MMERMSILQNCTRKCSIIKDMIFRDAEVWVFNTYENEHRFLLKRICVFLLYKKYSQINEREMKFMKRFSKVNTSNGVDSK